MVYNSPKMNTSQKHHDLPMEIVVDVRKVMPVFLTQFKALLGIPDISKVSVYLASSYVHIIPYISCTVTLPLILNKMQKPPH